MGFVSLITPSRIHFGLMEIHPDAPHPFGGLGVMVEAPGFALRLRQTSTEWSVQANAAWQDRIQQAAFQWSQYRQQPLPCIQLALLAAPPAHAGFGSGTQLACGVASLLEWEWHRRQGNLSLDDWQAPRSIQPLWGSDLEVAQQTLTAACGRGLRSMIGVHGFLAGGWLVDRGRGVSPRVEAIQANDAWRAVLVMARQAEAISGQQEAELIQQCASQPYAGRGQMQVLLEQAILPALRRHSLRDAEEGIYRYGCLAGGLFQTVQGGVFRNQQVSQAVESLRSLGVTAVGQSSWGPCVCGLVDSPQQAIRIQEALATLPDAYDCTVTKLNTQGRHLDLSPGTRTA